MLHKVRIHLADDHQILIDGIKTLLHTHSNLQVVGTSLSGSNLYQEVIDNQADLLVLDLNMPETDGVQVIREFNAKGFPCKVIVLSSHDDLRIIKEVMKLGAKGFLTKKCAGEHIIEAIGAVLDGEEYFCKAVREKIFTSATKDLAKASIFETKDDDNLTEREREIITLIALEFSGKEISEQLFISVNTVETHRKNIMKKLDAKNSISLVKYALKRKLIQ
ncbi:response regulator [Flavobacterium turcicum]|uniref:Response regulator transcription factor n=1 Tax=Flavobacterium turcicum TaxID=2764718 RepID=A0ABR7JHT5_9FLAO|nr:response regulator transcription factor [Flavobacterium turcicum]MBC5864061.1 response regulator transcription factor [Flavobacterium turcicum]NHL02827.1 response regulator transcription factor [Flavobacterium turcicum]